MRKIDTRPTRDAILSAASQMVRTAKELEHIAIKMDERSDLTYSAEAMSLITSMIGNLRLDLQCLKMLPNGLDVFVSLRLGSAQINAELTGFLDRAVDDPELQVRRLPTTARRIMDVITSGPRA